jgi:hypothetical protein
LRKLQGEWSWIWQGCKPIKKTDACAAQEPNIMSRKLMLGNFVFLYKTDLKIYN